MRFFLLGVAILAVAMQEPRPLFGGNDHIADQILKRLESEKARGNLRDFRILLRVEEGVVYLSGQIASREQEKLALEAAREADDVREIYNAMEIVASELSLAEHAPLLETAAISEPGRQVAALPASVAAGALPASSEAVKKPREDSGSHLAGMTWAAKQARFASEGQTGVEAADLEFASRQPSAAEAAQQSFADSKWIATRIIEQLRSAKRKGSIHGYSIDVEVDRGVVYLKGRVSSQAHRERTLDIARGVSGVKLVLNELRIGEAEDPLKITRQDQAVFRAVVTRLRHLEQGGDLRGFVTGVQVEQGAVWLTGSVSDSGEETSVLEAIRYIPGVKVVVNDLRIDAREAGFVRPSADRRSRP